MLSGTRHPQFVELQPTTGRNNGRPVCVQISPTVPFPIAGGLLGGGGGSRNEQGSSVERQGLLQVETKSDANIARMTMCIMVSLCVLLIGMIAMIVTLWVRVDDALSITQSAITPFIGDMVSFTAITLNNTRDLTTSLARLGRTAEMLAGQALPVLGHAVNTTASLLDKADAFSSNPVLSIASGRIG
jgi:hypothetical protein